MKTLSHQNYGKVLEHSRPHTFGSEKGRYSPWRAHSVTALPGPDFIYSHLKVTGDGFLKASGVFLHAYICPPDEETMLEQGACLAAPQPRGRAGMSGGAFLAPRPLWLYSCSMTSWKKLFLLLCCVCAGARIASPRA